MLTVCGINESMMPRLFESYQKIGTLKPEIAEVLGLSPKTVVAAGGGDNALAALGTGTVGEGKCNISLGTSGTVFIPSGSFPEGAGGAMHCFCHADGVYHLMGCMLSAASCNKWFCDGILGTKDYAAEQINITDDKLGRNDVYFLPYLMGERSPINDTDARGTFIGLRMDSSRADMVEAVLEGVAFAIRDNLELAKKQGVTVNYSTLCGGGAKSPLWQKIIANVLGIDIVLPKAEEGPAMGGAMLSMVASGEYDDIAKLSMEFFEEKARITPDSELVALYDEKYNKWSKIYPSVKNLFGKIK
jgi:xylulokinase